MEARLNVMLDRTKFMKWTVLLLSLVTMSLVGCDNGTFYGESEPEPIVDPTIPVVATIFIASSTSTVHSDNSDSSEITATVVDATNGPIKGATVDFTTTAGFISPSSIMTDATGVATISFSAGAYPANATAAISASSGGISSPDALVDIVGSSVTLTATSLNLTAQTVDDTATLTIKAMDSSGKPVSNAPVTASIDGTVSTGTVNMTIPPGSVTDSQGEFRTVIQGLTNGTVRVVATALNETAVLDFTIVDFAGSLSFVSPSSGTTVELNVANTVDITVPATTTDITLVTTVGIWGTSGSNVLTLTGVNSPTTISETLSSSAVGTASVSVVDTANPLVNDSIQLVFVDSIVDATSSVNLQASPTTIPIAIVGSTGTTESTSALIASVSDSIGGNKIANARVTFTISNSTGSGEYVSPAVTYTDASGTAYATLYAGTLSSSGTGLLVTASLDEALTTTPITSSASIIVGGTAASIDMRESTKLASIDSDTGYSLPVALQILDAANNPVANQTVYLTAWPEKYGLGYWACDPAPGLVREIELLNEDIDRDFEPDTLPVIEDISGDGSLTPLNSAGPGVPGTVTTGEDGRATYNITYNKRNAGFIYSAITATTLVQGTETRATLRFWLPALESDVNNCDLGESPFNLAWPILRASAPTSTTSLGGSVTITATLTNSDSTALAGKLVSSQFIVKGSESATPPSLSAPTLTTDASGVVSFAYTAGDQAGTDIIKLSYTVPTVNGDVVISDYLVFYVQ